MHAGTHTGGHGVGHGYLLGERRHRQPVTYALHTHVGPNECGPNGYPRKSWK